MNILQKVCRKIEELLCKYLYFYPLGYINWICPKYRVAGAETYDIRDLVEFKNPFLYKKSFKIAKKEFLRELQQMLKRRDARSLVRLGDSEAYFLRGELIGNIIKRTYTSAEKRTFDLQDWKEKLLLNDLIFVEERRGLKKILKGYFKEGEIGEKKRYIPIPYIIIATKELFHLLKEYKVGLIGAKEKMALIQKLMMYHEYRKYLGIDKFEEYICIPQKGATNDWEDTYELIKKQIGNACDIYLVGMSVAKIQMLPRLRDSYKKIFFDIGTGIDAIAGIIPQTKNNMGSWINYKLRDFDYSRLDIFTWKKQSVYARRLEKYLN